MSSVLVVLAVAAPAAAHVSLAAITAGRARALVVVAVGLISVILGGLALARSAAGGNRRGRSIAALATGLIGIGLSGLHLASSTAIGTGSGRLGAIVALTAALIGAALGGLALTRSLRTR